MIMLGFMETEKEFIKNWEKYRGAAGCLRYLACWFLLGIIVIPLMLTAINPDIWSVYGADGSAGGRSRRFFRVRLLVLHSSFPAYRAGHVG